jgi:hypothetical protein
MASLDDLAGLILHHREAAERLFDSEIEKLNHIHGPAIVRRALELADCQGERRDAISITASRARHQAERTAELQVQQHFRKQHDDDEPPLPRSLRGVYRRRDM